jgi:hypothetical protein
MSVRLLGTLLLAAVAMALVAAGTLVFLARSIPPVQSAPDGGSASTLIGGPVGFELAISDVHIPAAGGLVTMAASFRNTSPAQQRADPLDFTLRDGPGATVRPTFDAACPRWARADLHPAGGQSRSPRDAGARQVGASFGPVPLCFAVAHPSAAPTLMWSPDIGLLGSTIAIPLR